MLPESAVLFGREDLKVGSTYLNLCAHVGRNELTSVCAYVCLSLPPCRQTFTELDYSLF